MKVLRFGLVVVLFYFTTICSKGFSQTSPFVKFYNFDLSYVNSLYVTQNNEFILLASGVLIKAVNDGSQAWGKYLRGNNEYISSKKVIADQDGNIFLCGWSATPITHGMSPARIFLAKYSSTGDSLWWKSYDKAPWSQQAEDMMLTGDGGFLVSGLYSSDSTRGFLSKFNSKGDSLWQKNYRIGDLLNDITSFQTDENGVMLIGSYENNFPFIWGRYDSFLMRTDLNGNLVRQERIHEDSSSVAISQLIKLSDGNFAFLTYSHHFFVGSYRTNLRIIDEIGNTLLDKVIGTSNIYYIIAPSLDDGVILAYKINLSQIGILKLNRYGETVWSKTFDFFRWGNTITCDAIAVVKDKSIIISGTILNNSNIKQVYLLKTDSLGTITEVPDRQKTFNFSLMQNFPNPFNPITKIDYSIPSKSFVELKVYNLLGKEVATLVNEFQNAGSHSVQFNGSDLPSGVYIYSIKTGEFSDSKKLVIIK